MVVLDPDTSKSRVISNLPESYTDVVPVESKTTQNLFVPQRKENCKPNCNLAEQSMKDEYRWLREVENLLSKKNWIKQIIITQHGLRTPQKNVKARRNHIASASLG